MYSNLYIIWQWKDAIFVCLQLEINAWFRAVQKSTRYFFSPNSVLQEKEEDAGRPQDEDVKHVHKALWCGPATLRWETGKSWIIASVPRAPCLTSVRRWWRPVDRLPASKSAPRSYRRSVPPSCYSRSSGCSPESQTWTRTFSLPVNLTVLCCFSVDP